MLRRSLLTAAATLAASRMRPARAQDAPLKVALVATLSGPAAAIGTQIRDGWMLGMTSLGQKLGGRPVETLVIDDELKPDVALSRVREALEREHADFVVGVVFSNILQAIVRPVTESRTFLLSTNAGPSTFAGKGCNPYLFVTSYQNDQPHSVMGQAAQDAGYKSAVILVPNYQAGKDAAAGFKSRFKGEIADELYVPLNQLDFSAELAKIAAAKPEALFTFMPGGLGVNLVRQYRQAGLEKIPFLSTFTVDESTLPAQGDAALGFFSGADWAPDFNAPASHSFVRDYEAAYNAVPGTYAAHTYDAALLIDAALKTTGGSTADKPALRKAIEAATFASVRGTLKFGKNHYPLQDFFLCKVVKNADGKYQTAIVRKVLSDDVDPYAASCAME